MNPKIVISSLSIVSPLGTSLLENWENIKKNISGITPLENKDIIRAETLYSGEIKKLNNENKNRWVAIFDLLISDFKDRERVDNTFFEDSMLIIASAFFGIENKSFNFNKTLRYIKTKYNFKQIILNSNSCASGNFAIAVGANLIKKNIYKKVFIVGIDILTNYLIAGFESLKMISKKGSKPFSKYRDGLTLGEGGALILLEKKKDAKKKDRQIYCEYGGFGYSVDNSGLTGMDKTLNGALLAYNRAIASAALKKEDISLISAHATGTILNDKIEAASILSFFSHKPLITVFKSYIGHTMGSSSALSAAFLAMCIKENIVIKINNLIDEEFNLNYAYKNINLNIKNALNNSFGFGGINSCLVLKKEEA